MLLIPLQISSVCRQIHACLTGRMALCSDVVDERSMNTVWGTLDRCWRDLDQLRQYNMDVLEAEDINRFIHSWQVGDASPLQSTSLLNLLCTQIYIFKCGGYFRTLAITSISDPIYADNVIRESLKQRLPPGAPQTVGASSMDRRSIDLLQLYQNAKMRCRNSVRSIITIIRQNLGTDFFRFDSCLVRDGCFYAAYLLANDSGSQGEVDTCITALREMRWIFSKSDERINTLRLIWESRIRNESPNPSDGSAGDLLVNGYSGVRRQPDRTHSVPPLALTMPHNPSELSQSAPTTAYSEDGRWPVHTAVGDSSVRTTLPPRGSIHPHLGSPLVQHHSPSRYRQPLPTMAASSVGGSIPSSSSNMMAGPSSLGFARPEAVQSYYALPTTSYDYATYDDPSTGDHAHSSSDSTNTPPPPPVRYPSTQYFSDPVTYPTGAVGSPSDTLQPSPAPAPDEIGGGPSYHY